MITLRWWEWGLSAMAASLLLILLYTPQAGAFGCGQVRYPVNYGYPTYVAPAVNYHQDYEVKKRVVVLEYQLIPPFPIGYAPAAPYAAPMPLTAPTPCDAKTAALEAKLAALEAKLGAGGSPTPGVPPDALPNKAPKALPTLFGKCAACHNDKDALVKGGKLILFSNGVVTVWTPETMGKVLKEVSSGRMPKGTTKLTQDEFAALAQELFDLASK